MISLRADRREIRARARAMAVELAERLSCLGLAT
jgi:hypothetical protein